MAFEILEYTADLRIKVSWETTEEAPTVYKDVNQVISIVDVVGIVKKYKGKTSSCYKRINYEI